MLTIEDIRAVPLFSNLEEPELERLARTSADLHLAALTEDDSGVSVTLEGTDGSADQRFDRVLVAIGRRPNSKGIGLEKTSVHVDENGFVTVDDQPLRNHDRNEDRFGQSVHGHSQRNTRSRGLALRLTKKAGHKPGLSGA